MYGADLRSQYQAVPLIEAAIARWGRATRSRVGAAGAHLRITEPEKLCLTYLKTRLQRGHTFFVPRRLALTALAADADGSSLAAADIVAAFYSPGARACRLQPDDVVFHVVDERPENKHIFQHEVEVRVTSQIVVRAHQPTTAAGDLVPNAWALERWDLRSWVKSGAAFVDVMGNLLRCHQVSDSTRFVPALADRAPRSFALPPVVHDPSDDQLTLSEFLDLSPARVRDLEVDIFATLVGALDRGKR